MTLGKQPKDYFRAVSKSLIMGPIEIDIVDYSVEEKVLYS